MANDPPAGRVAGAVPPLRLTGGRVTLRSATAADRPALARILADPSVTHWWHVRDLEGDLGELLRGEDHVPLAIELDGAVVGYLQYSEEPDPDYRSAGIDLFVESAAQGRGVGPAAIRLCAAYLFDVLGHHRLTIDPAATNERAIRAYEKVGFRRVGVMRDYERGLDDTWHDGVLMDLLRGELRPEPAA